MSCAYSRVPPTLLLPLLPVLDCDSASAAPNQQTRMNHPQDEWVLMGGKGKPRRTPQQQQQHLEARSKAAAVLAAVTHSDHHHQHHHHDVQHQAGQQACSTEQLQLAQQQLAAVAAAMAGSSSSQAQPLPGWGPPLEREWKVACSSNSKKKKGRARLPSTPHEQVQYISQQVQDIAQQLLSTPMYNSLLAAMQQAAPGLMTQQQQQQQQQGTQAGQQQQQLPSASSSWSWGDIQELVVYGLGSAEDSKVSRHQLALALLLQRLLPGLRQPPQLYDPAFSEVDVLLLQQLGLQVIGHNEEGRRQVQGPTLAYLPHCEGVLCDNLLCANCSPAALGQLCILGNSFATYQQRWSGPEGSRPKTRRPDMLLQLVEQGAVAELSVPDFSYHVASAFNDMSLHTFNGRGVHAPSSSSSRAGALPVS